MGLSSRDLLNRYFYKEDIQNALQSVGEPVTGNKGQLIRHLLKIWEGHNRSFYSLFDFLDRDILDDFCKDYGIEHYGFRDDLIRKIKRADPLGIRVKKTRKIRIKDKPTKQVKEEPPVAQVQTIVQIPIIRRLRFRWPLLVSLFLTIMMFLLLPLLGLTQLTTQLVGVTVFFLALYTAFSMIKSRF